MKAEPTNRRAIRIVSQCASAEEFLAVFHPYLERDALFIATGSPEEPGAHLRFVMTLAGGEPMMKGGAVVLESHRDRSNFYGLRGMKVRFDELDDVSRRTLQRLGSGPTSRRAASSAGIAGARRAVEVVECLIFEEPGTEAADPIQATRALMDSLSGEPEPEPPPLGADDDVTAVAPPPQPRPEATLRDLEPVGASAQRTVRDPAMRFIVPPPKSDPAIVPPERPADPAAVIVDAAGIAAAVASPAAVDAAPAASHARDGNGAAVPAPPVLPAAPPAPGESGLSGSVFELGPALDAGSERGSAPALAQLPTMRLNAAPRRNDTPLHQERPPTAQPVVSMPTPTEIVSPLALRTRTSKPPLPPERTQLVQVGHVRTAVICATLGALLGLGAGYLLWGLPHESRPVLVAPIDAAVPATAPAPPPAPAPAVTDAGPGASASAPEPPEELRVQRALRLVSTPPGAEVIIDKRRAGVTPFELPLEDTEAMTVTLRKVGYRPWTKMLAGDELDTTFEVVLRRNAPVRRK